jgi:alkanesulfonate monooxygenase SsuD/methylene tetrahydromethanopterin reductase-like flavin-dependent oxidoreductase (luciferase family)
MKFGVAVPGLTQFPGLGGQDDWTRQLSTADVCAVARHADELGYAYLAVPWHIAIQKGEWEKNMGARWPHSLSAAGFLLGATSRITVSPLIVVPCEQPIPLAKALSTLDWMSGGRCTPVLLTGYIQWEFELLGVNYAEREQIMDEYVEAMIALWTSDDPTYEGRFVSFSDVAFEPKPVQQPFPLWFGGKATSRRALRRVARWGSGWMSYASVHRDHPGAIDYIRSQPEFRADSSLEISAYFVEPTHDPHSHAEARPPELVLGVEPVLERVAYLESLGVTSTYTPLTSKTDAKGRPEPITSLRDYLDRLSWFAEEIVPKLPSTSA